MQNVPCENYRTNQNGHDVISEKRGWKTSVPLSKLWSEYVDKADRCWFLSNCRLQAIEEEALKVCYSYQRPKRGNEEILRFVSGLEPYSRAERSTLLAPFWLSMSRVTHDFATIDMMVHCKDGAHDRTCRLLFINLILSVLDRHGGCIPVLIP